MGKKRDPSSRSYNMVKRERYEYKRINYGLKISHICSVKGVYTKSKGAERKGANSFQIVEVGGEMFRKSIKRR